MAARRCNSLFRNSEMCTRTILFAVLLALAATQELTSPCPKLLVIKNDTFEAGSLDATLIIDLQQDIVGLFLQIQLDSKINMITNNFGITTTLDNQNYLLEDFNYKPRPKPTNIDISIKYNGAMTMPQVKKIFINGRLECPPRKPGPSYKSVPFIDIFEDSDYN